MATTRVTDDLRVAVFVQILQGSVKAVYSSQRRACSERQAMVKGPRMYRD